MDEFDWLVKAMNSLEMVTWDRLTLSGKRGSVFGWIDRPDGRCDFVLLYWDRHGFGYSTSSATYSRRIGERLGFEPGTHRDCKRVSEVFGEAVTRVCQQKRSEHVG